MEEWPKETLCDRCAKDANLVKLIREQGRRGKCTLCGKRRSHIVENSSIANQFKAVVRYHYNEVEYNDDLGGKDLASLLESENPILNTAGRRRDDDDFEFGGYLKSLTFRNAPNETEVVYLYREFATSLQEAPSDDIDKLVSALRTTNYYALEDTWIEKMKPLAPKIAATIPTGKSFYRARIGVRDELWRMKWDGDFSPKYVHFPFVGPDIGPPPHTLARPGRLNRANIVALYLATTLDTALAEVRPHPGHSVSLGEFRSKLDLKIANLAGVELLPFATSERMLEVFVLLRNIEHAFAMPVLPDDPAGYLLTQFLADVFRRIGFDGVTYRSSIAEGTNLVVFDPSTFDYVKGSGTVRKVTSLTYRVQTPEVEQEKLPGHEEDYWKATRWGKGKT